MNNVHSIAQSLTSNINAEVNELRDRRNNMIGMREVGREFANKFLFDMEELVEGTHQVKYTDDRGEESIKEQKKNHSLWLVALQTTIEVGHVTYELLGSNFVAWAKETLGCEWDIKQATALASKFVESMRESNIIAPKKSTIDWTDSEGVVRKQSVNKLSDDMLVLIEETVEELRTTSHMVCKPLRNQPEDWINTETGVGENAGLKLIKGQRYKGHKIDPRVLEAVNKLQAVKFVVSPAMVDLAYDMIDNQGVFNPTVEELRMYEEAIAHQHGEWYFPITMDTRGRMYYRGGILTPQGTDFAKACWQFAESKPLGATGYMAVMIHTANTLGLDKLPLNRRLEEIEKLIPHLHKLNNYHDVKKHFPKSDLCQATVAILELKRIHDLIEELGPESVHCLSSNLVCHQDGTCNGLQHMAAITHNMETAIAVNCVESTWADVPADIYGMVADEAAKRCADPMAKALIEKYGRSMAKNPVMITGYGAGKDTVIKNTGKYLAEHNENSTLAEVIGEAYIAALEFHAGAVKTLTSALKSRVETAIETGLRRIKWKTADGFLACTEYMDLEDQRVRAGKFNALVKSATPAPRDDVKTIGAMAPNFVHSIDATHLRLVVRACDHDLVTVHDSIGSHAATYFETAKAIRETFVEVHQYDALDNLCNELKVRKPNFIGDYDVNQALKSTYIFS